tara:strand:- start:130 stop:408 length:279 start_codon:yes stop_codon:yes gene_type:complete
MENEGLDHLISLIENSLDLESPEKIKKIEEEIQTVFQKLKATLFENSDTSEIIDKEKINKLGELLEKLKTKHSAQKKFLDDFSSFLKNRKIN